MFLLFVYEQNIQLEKQNLKKQLIFQGMKMKRCMVISLYTTSQHFSHPHPMSLKLKIKVIRKIRFNEY